MKNLYEGLPVAKTPLSVAVAASYTVSNSCYKDQMSPRMNTLDLATGRHGYLLLVAMVTSYTVFSAENETFQQSNAIKIYQFSKSYDDQT